MTVWPSGLSGNLYPNLIVCVIYKNQTWTQLYDKLSLPGVERVSGNRCSSLPRPSPHNNMQRDQDYDADRDDPQD